MICQELRIEQLEAALDEPRRQMHQCHFAGIAFARKHTFAEERSTQPHPV
jgi:hypothetical protein